jgi:hypothetical protein
VPSSSANRRSWSAPLGVERFRFRPRSLRCRRDAPPRRWTCRIRVRTNARRGRGLAGRHSGRPVHRRFDPSRCEGRIWPADRNQPRCMDTGCERLDLYVPVRCASRNAAGLRSARRARMAPEPGGRGSADRDPVRCGMAGEPLRGAESGSRDRALHRLGGSSAGVGCALRRGWRESLHFGIGPGRAPGLRPGWLPGTLEIGPSGPGSVSRPLDRLHDRGILYWQTVST